MTLRHILFIILKIYFLLIIGREDYKMKKFCLTILAMVFLNSCIIKVENDIVAYKTSISNAVEDSLSIMNVEIFNNRLKNNILKKVYSDPYINDVNLDNIKITNKTVHNDILYIEIYGLNDFYIISEDLQNIDENIQSLFIHKVESGYEVYSNTIESNVFKYVGKLQQKF